MLSGVTVGLVHTYTIIYYVHIDKLYRYHVIKVIFVFMCCVSIVGKLCVYMYINMCRCDR